VTPRGRLLDGVGGWLGAVSLLLLLIALIAWDWRVTVLAVVAWLIAGLFLLIAIAVEPDDR
jgi:hypothetical protein